MRMMKRRTRPPTEHVERQAARAGSKGWARSLLPPLLWDALSGLSRRGRTAEWEYVGRDWQAAQRGRAVIGWNAAQVAEAYARRWPSWLDAIAAPRPLSVGHETSAPRVSREDLGMHNTLVAFAYVLTLAARGKDRLQVLDWGGALGQYAALARSVVPELALDYHCRETHAVCAAGRRLNPGVSFHETDDVLADAFDLVLASSALHYAEDWPAVLGRLASATREFLYIARLPVVASVPSFLVLQRADAYGYGTEYVGWCVNRDHFLRAATESTGLELRREFALLPGVDVSGAPERAEVRGFLFVRSGDRAPRAS